jgi:hypothetical protein
VSDYPFVRGFTTSSFRGHVHSYGQLVLLRFEEGVQAKMSRATRYNRRLESVRLTTVLQ